MSFGEIEDEFDRRKMFIGRIGENAYSIDARTELDRLREDLVSLNCRKATMKR